MLWIVALAFLVACIALGVISLRRKHHVWAVIWFALGILVFVTPLATLSIKVELPPAAKHF